LIGGGLVIGSAAYESSNGTLNTHTFVDLGVTAGALLVGAGAVVVGVASAPVWAFGAALVGVVYGVASVAGLSDAIDKWSDLIVKGIYNY
jgi:hypothetical protein